MFEDVINTGEALTKEEVQKLKNYAIFILDESGSMQSMLEQAQSMFNEQMRSVFDSVGEMPTEIWVRRFNTKVQNIVKTFVNEEEVGSMLLRDYAPGEMTALYDAVGMTIQELKKQPDINDPNTSVLFIIISDGMENCSVEFTSGVADMISELEATGRWTFLYQGTNHDAFSQAGSMAVRYGNTYTFNYSDDGFKNAMLDNSAVIGAYFETRSSVRGFSGTTCAYSALDKKTAKDDDN